MPYYNNHRYNDYPQNIPSTCQVPIPVDKKCNSLAMASIIPQSTNSPTFDLNTALYKGTIYKELDKPFLGGRCK